MVYSEKYLYHVSQLSEGHHPISYGDRSMPATSRTTSMANLVGATSAASGSAFPPSSRTHHGSREPTWRPEQGCQGRHRSQSTRSEFRHSGSGNGVQGLKYQTGALIASAARTVWLSRARRRGPQDAGHTNNLRGNGEATSGRRMCVRCG